jgi:hypothetical protein
VSSHEVAIALIMLFMVTKWTQDVESTMLAGMTIWLIVSNQPHIIEYCEKIREWTCKRRQELRKRIYIYFGRKENNGTILTETRRNELVCMATTKGDNRKEDFLHENTAWIGIDTLSTYCLTNDLDDIDISTRKEVLHKVTGIAGKHSSTITYEGCGRFKLVDDVGHTCTIPVPEMYYCSTVPYKIISPQHIDQCWRKEGLGTFSTSTDGNGTIIEWRDSTGKSHHKTIQHSRDSNIPLCHTAPKYRRYKSYLKTNYKDRNDERVLVACLSSTDRKDENNLLLVDTEGVVKRTEDPEMIRTDVELPRDPDQAKEIRKKPVLFDVDEVPRGTDVSKDEFQDMSAKTEKLLWHYRLGHLPFSAINRLSENGELPKRLFKAPDPLCASCTYGAMTRRAWRSQAKPRQVSGGKTIVKPGDCISVDQMQSPVPGLIAQTKGNPMRDRYNCATIFVDHYSDATYVHLQASLSAKDTIEAKETFERWSKSHGVTINHYHADNGRFSENEWMAHIAKMGQSITFCGVNAHFQNGRAERRIRSLQDQGRTQLLHAMARWSIAISHHLWPYAITNVAIVMNDTTRKGEVKSRSEMFSGSEISPNLKDHHHFGCPTYVLDNSLQGGNSIPKWLPRARVGVYLGKSLKHARNVSLVLNPRTGMVSAQYHVKVDDTFETIRGLRESTHGTWKEKCGFTREPGRGRKITTGKQPKGVRINQVKEVDLVHENLLEKENVPGVQMLEEEDASNIPADFGEAPQDYEGDEFLVQAQVQEPDPHHEGTIRRSNRTWKPTKRFLEGAEQESYSIPVALQASVYDEDYLTFIDDVSPICLLAKTGGDTMYWDQAVRQHDADKFIDAAVDEVNTHQKNGHWAVIAKQDVPNGQPVLDAVWSMKRKRRLLTNEIYKWKARLNLHGGQQEYGINYWETYAPVVTWAAIRLILVLVLMYQWTTVQIDFVLAYPQADVECDLYMKIPKGFEIQGGTRATHVLKLIKNLYGQKQAGRVWNKHLHAKLLELGWVQSQADECLYYKGSVLFVVYVDDGILVSPSEMELSKELEILKNKFKISVEGSLSDYVGVNIERTDDGKIHMTQPNIVKSIIKDLNFTENTKSTSTPALSTKVLEEGQNNPPHVAEWGYRNVIGKLNFLSSSCRPEIACAVHQAARYSANPKTNHTEAVKRIVRYLKGTVEKGIIFDPTDHSFEVYVDADFGGLWNKEDAVDKPITAKSRTGYVIKYAGCPIVWGSTLQSEFALSTTEAEYLALSTALRQVIPLMRLVDEIKLKVGLNLTTIPVVKCNVFEDNTGAVELANVPKMRPRTKHINSKYHHFRKHVFDGTIKVQHIRTEEQQADILTKNLGVELFEKFRKQILGW